MLGERTRWSAADRVINLPVRNRDLDLCLFLKFLNRYMARIGLA